MIQNEAGTSAVMPRMQVGWLIAARMALASLALLYASIQSAEGPAPHAANFTTFFGPILTVYGICAVSALWLKFYKPTRLFAYVQLLCDGFFVTGLIYLSGGPGSPFLFLYLPHIMAAAIILSRRGALAIGILDFCVYMALVYGLWAGWIAAPSSGTLVLWPRAGLFYQALGLGSAMTLIAIATSFLARRLRFSDAALEASQRALAHLSNRQKQLINNIPEGVITTNLEQAITSINQAALELLSVSEPDALGRKLEELIGNASADQAEPSKITEANEGEVNLLTRSGEKLTAKFQAQEIESLTGEKIGKVISLRDVSKLRLLEDKLELHERMARLLAGEGQDSQTPAIFSHFVGESAVMQKIFSLIARVAQSDATVLIDGESGTGKELVARAIHSNGPRAEENFVPVNCGAIPENLIESELFGHKKGSFTGATADHGGLFKQADSGTLFLDEIGELPLSMQSKLLRAIQEKRIRPVGADQDFPINVRIIAATNRNLKKEVELGHFREDLYYRLNVIHIMLPPLRDRKSDIPLLTNSILRRITREDRVSIVTPEAMQLLMAYNYPGNVRELENILERAQVMGGHVILPEHFPDAMRQGPSGGGSAQPETSIIIQDNITFPVQLDELLNLVERKYLEGALLQTGGAKKRAATLLGMNFRSFRYRLQKFGIGDGEEEASE